MNQKIILASLLLCAATSMQATPISRAEARLVAQEFIGIDDASSDNMPIAPYYVFSRGKGRGYVIVSGDDTTTPIIGYTEQGDFETDRQAEPMKAMLDGWASRISAVQARKVTGPRRSPAQRIAQAVAAYKANWQDVPVLVQTHWHQDTPYNDMVPTMSNGKHCATGCVATAGSQVAYYFHKDNPGELQYATPTYGYGVAVTQSLPKGTPIEWDKMKLRGSGTAEQNKAVATLVYALGASAGLTYGESTSGHNYRAGYWNMADALSGQFFIDYKYKSKSECSQQAWETLIYNDLKTRRPVLYSGVHPSNGGHSVVLDGYQASTGLFHFNFGWGGQSDGWYTVDDETGMNGFKDYQDIVYNFTPRYQNLQVSLEAGTIYEKAPSYLSVTVANNGTLDFDGIYLYSSTSASRIPNSASATNHTPIAAGTTATIEFQISPMVPNSLYLFICDKNKRILDSCRVEIAPTKSALSLNNLHVDAGTDETVVDGMTFKTVNNTTARINVNLTNGEGGTYCSPSFNCMLETYDVNTKVWTTVNRATISKLTFQEGQTRDTLFTFSNLNPNKLYRALLGREAITSTTDPLRIATTDSVAYFTVREPSLTAATTQRHAVLSGLWDATLFQEISQNERICSYDLTDVQQIVSNQISTANPNALFYTATDKPELAGRPNVVVNGQCNELVIHSAGDFKPNTPFTATHAKFVVDEAVAGLWAGTLVPFAAQVPYGMQAKKPESATSSSFKHGHTLSVDAMTPIIYITGHDAHNTFEASNVAIATDTVASSLDGKITASTISMPLDESWYVLGTLNDLPYFLPWSGNDHSEARFVPIATTHSATLKWVSTSSELSADLAYRSLAQAINEAYTALSQGINAPESARQALQAELKVAEDILSYRSSTSDTAVKAAAQQLLQAVETFSEAVLTGIAATPVRADHAGAAPEYFSLSGQRTGQPRRGSIVIMRQGGQTKKITIR